jgi:hypothetical protein
VHGLAGADKRAGDVESRAVPSFVHRGVAARVAVALVFSAGLSRTAPAPDAENAKLPPSSSDELTERARHLFDAVVQGKPELADDFFFPREPFLSLKDVANPARYHAQLVAAFHHDLRDLHASRRSWEGATFQSIELGTVPRWVKPGEEWNKIGYHRTYRAKLRFSIAGRVRWIEVHTVISWDGRWYVTHLSPVHH